MANSGGGASFEFIADRPVLDYVATVAERGTTNVERLCTGADLARWVHESGILTHRLNVTTWQLEQAKTLREASFGLITALIDGTNPSRTERALVNRVATRARPRSQLSPTGQVRRTGDLDSVFAVLATDCIDLFDGPDRQLVSWCANPTCTRPFIDRSRGHRRRWCDMKGCGDRAKAVAYRRRRSPSAPGSTTTSS